ncbi:MULTISPECIES: hypothetical protein [unclassified Pseudomonas]|uniref:hypothetical protein n=1 Tax=unclassified Pseudomonas TaxID=196821 RepID=UPI00244BE125|nr:MULTISPECIES: hypothetical protein [unclassified Pseudomonas]MDH0304179.1 hypothetical protein [Pseudomonas sp. GD04091]MDH1986218.1 hypothetical protein [Pseudomonas sp. GD03689]
MVAPFGDHLAQAYRFDALTLEPGHLFSSKVALGGGASAPASSPRRSATVPRFARWQASSCWPSCWSNCPGWLSFSPLWSPLTLDSPDPDSEYWATSSLVDAVLQAQLDGKPITLEPLDERHYNLGLLAPIISRAPAWRAVDVLHAGGRQDRDLAGGVG